MSAISPSPSPSSSKALIKPRTKTGSTAKDAVVLVGDSQEDVGGGHLSREGDETDKENDAGRISREGDIAARSAAAARPTVRTVKKEHTSASVDLEDEDQADDGLFGEYRRV